MRCEIETQYTQHEERLSELQVKLDQVSESVIVYFIYFEVVLSCSL